MGIETQSQVPGVTGPVPVTTPTFSGAPVPGVGGGAQTTTDPNQKAKEILAMLLQAGNRKQMGNTAVPSPIPGLTDPNEARSIGMNTAWPHAWGTQRFLAGLSGNIKNAVAKQKQNQLVKAEGDWTYLQSAMNELYAAQQSGDQQATQAAQLKVDAVLGDPKKLKNMAKALNQDWLNPEKTTVYGEALKKVAAQSKQKDQAQAQDAQQKQQAATGLKGLFQKLIRERQQPQLSDEQRKAMAGEIQAKAPTTTPGLDKETAAALRQQMRDEAQTARDEARDAARQKELEQKQEWQREETEMKEKFQRQRDEMQNNFHRQMETMRETATEQRQHEHDLMMMKMLGMKLDAQQEKLFKPDPSKLDKEVNDSVTSLRQQLAQEQGKLKSLKTSASNHWLMGPGKSEIAEQQDQVDSLKRAIEHIEKNRDDVVKGKAQLSDVINKAYDIMGGGGGQPTPGAGTPPPPPVPGAVVTKQ